MQTMSLVSIKYLLDQGRQVKRNPNLPQDFKLLILVGSSDCLCLPAATKKYFDNANIPNKTFKSYEGAYTKLLCEPEFKTQVYNDIIEWILKN